MNIRKYLEKNFEGDIKKIQLWKITGLLIKQ